MSRDMFLTPAQLAARWGGAVSVRTLANWRSVGKGPRYVKIGGRVRYRLSDVEAYEKARSVRSTSQYEGDTFKEA